MFQMCFSDPNQGMASAEYIADQQLGTKIGVIYKSDDVYSTGILEQFKAEAESKRLHRVTEQAFTTETQNDFSVQLNACKSAGADLLFLPIYYTPASLILTQANAMGLYAQVLWRGRYGWHPDCREFRYHAGRGRYAADPVQCGCDR